MPLLRLRRAIGARLRRLFPPPARVLRRLETSEAERLERHALVGPAALWLQKREFQFGFLRRSGLAPRHHLLDLGCGTLRGGIPLIEYLEPGHYTGIESRTEVLEEALRELAEAGLEVRRPDLRLCTQLSALELPGRFDFAWAFSVLIHMDDGPLAEALGFVARHLAGAGALYANVNLGRAPERRWQGFPVVTRPFGFYAAQAERAGLRVEALGPLREFGHFSGNAAADAQVMLRFAPK